MKTILEAPSPNQISASGNNAIAGKGLNMLVSVSSKSDPTRVVMAKKVSTTAHSKPIP